MQYMFFFLLYLTQTVKGGRLLFHFTPHDSLLCIAALLQPFYNQYVTLHIYPRVICNCNFHVRQLHSARFLFTLGHTRQNKSVRPFKKHDQ